MGAKEQILERLSQAQGDYVSGTALAAELGLSRNAVWKAINQLKADGLAVTATTNHGYALISQPDLLTENGIAQHCPSASITVLKTVDSTNNALRKLAETGAAEGSVVVAETQTEGRGRMGRSFYSPKKTGVYFSILVRPEADYKKASMLTVIAAVAAAEASEEVFGQSIGIKWVNDLYLNGKKCAGILTEATTDLESGGVKYAVVGIGFNLMPPPSGFPDDIKHVAGALSTAGTANARNDIVGKTIAKFLGYYANFDKTEISDKYISRSIVLGKRLTVISGGISRGSTALSIDRDCHLTVRFDDGEVKTLAFGEVRLSLC